MKTEVEDEKCKMKDRRQKTKDGRRMLDDSDLDQDWKEAGRRKLEEGIMKKEGLGSDYAQDYPDRLKLPLDV